MNFIDKQVEEYFNTRNINKSQYYPYSLSLMSESSNNLSMVFVSSVNSIEEKIELDMVIINSKNSQKYLEEMYTVLLSRVVELINSKNTIV